jgi:predicted glycogen debranching enzyme
MGYIKFDKNQLINLEYSLDKEMVRSNRAGSFSCTTILGCNTRKYHGLLFTPQPELDGELHLLLSKVDETISQRDASFNLGVNRFPGTFSPKGHKYVRDFSADVIPVVTYRVGGVILTKETMFVSRQERVLIKYTLLEAHSPTKLKLKPFLAFRNIHRLSKKNIDLDTRYQPVQNGIKVRMYQGYTDLYMQLSKKGGEYVHVPDWYNDFEYPLEKERGYEYHEDLYNPGFFEIDIKKGESIIFSASTAETRPASLSRMFNLELQKRTPRNSFENCLVNSAEQFFYSHSGKSGVIAGFPWYSQITRYTFISLPGLSRATTDQTICEQILDSLIADMKGPSFPEVHRGMQASYDSADTALWFFCALQGCFSGKKETTIWKKYGPVMKAILNGYAQAEFSGIRLHDNGLLHIDEQHASLTWMNARVHGQAVTPRYGYVVEVNALWYNAISFAISLAKKTRDKEFTDKWKPLASKISQAFTNTFWLSGQNYLADWVYDGKPETSVRPNQLFAISLPYPVLEESRRKYVLDVIIKELLTPRGLRSLSPKDPKYIGRYEGDENKRDNALHQGTVWPWLLGHFSDAYLNLYGNNNSSFIRNIYNGFQTISKENGIGSVSELYNGDPPHLACGAPSFAPSVAELIRVLNRLSPEKKNEE